MTLLEIIEKRSRELLLAAVDQSEELEVVLRALAAELGITGATVREALAKLVRKKKLALTFRHHKVFLEIPTCSDVRQRRPFKVVIDKHGEPWICDMDVDPSRDLASQGCWQLPKNFAKKD
ncbi:MAG: GntR family transcriptional regulator [Deltaproteobacteria bacterium]|nr:GntR family transcriptional regulator [Deltaproteobacteria bacterium]MBW2071091.1 GntR family transcriptional regulator [Deltaproteobacteria bacterium]